jgi:hypothetical protein
MSALSGLRDSCRDFVGRPLSIHFVCGWGWTVSTPHDCVAYEGELAINDTYAEVVPTSFFAHDGASTRGFLGRITRTDHLLHEMPILAITMSDGFDYDFTTTVCGAWRFWIGDGELLLTPNLFPRLQGPRIIGGYGSVAANASWS